MRQGQPRRNADSKERQHNGPDPHSHNGSVAPKHEKAPSPSEDKAGGLRSIRSRLLARLALQVVHRIDRDVVPGYRVTVTQPPMP